MSQGDLEIRVGANTSGLQAGMIQAANVTDAQMKKIAQYVKAATAEQERMTASVKSVAANSASYKAMADGAEKVRAGHAGVNRELLVLTHELSQGNFSRFGGSMLVLAERTNALEFAMSGAGAATLAIGGALLGTVALIAKGAIDSDKFAKSMQLTGNYAAVTTEQLKAMAEAQSKQTGQTSGAAHGSLEAVAGSGLFGASQIAVAARALGDYQKLTGETAADALKNFTSIQDGVAKWAAEQNKSVHFLTLTQYDHIKSLEDTGNKERAAIEALTAYSSTIEGRAAPSLGMLARAWHAVAEAASGAGQAIMNAGRPSTTDSHLADLQSQLADLTKRSPRGSSPDMNEDMGRGRTRGDQVASIQRQIASLQGLAGAEKMARDEQAKMAAIQAQAIDGQAYEASILRQAHALSERTQELQKWAARRDLDKAAGHPMSAADYQSGVNSINKQFASEGGKQYDDITAKIKAFNEATEQEWSSLKKLTDGQRLVIQVQEQLATSASKMTVAEKESAKAEALRAASLREMADASLALKKSLTEDADRAVKEAATAFAAQQKAMQSFQRSGASKVSDIDFQTSLIGKSPEDAAKAQAMRAIDLAANQALEASGGKRLNEILAEQAKQRDEVAAAMDREAAKQRELAASFSGGWDKSMQDFAKQANDNAANGKKAFEDMANGATAAITQFAMTGKFSVKSMVNSMIQDLIRFEAQKGVAALAGLGGSSGLWSSLGSLFSGGAGVGSGGDYSSAGLAAAFASVATPHANGLDYVPYNGYPAILHEGEKVMTKQAAVASRKGGDGHTININMGGFSVGAGVDASTVAQAVRTGMAQAKADIHRSLTTNGRMS